MYKLELIISGSEYKEFEDKLGLTKLPKNTMYLRPGFFKNNLFLIRSLLCRENFKKFINILKIKNVELEYSKLI